MGIKGALFLFVIVISILYFIIDSMVPEGNLHAVLIGLSSGITLLAANLIAGNFKHKK